MNVTLPDGTVIEDVPEGITKSQLMARLAKMDAKAKQDADYQRNLGEERQKMMDERGFLENLAAGAGKALTDTGRGIAQWLPGGPSREDIDKLKALDAPLMESGGGITGNLVGDIALSLAPLGAGKAAQMIPAVGRTLAASPKAQALAQAMNPNTVIGGGTLGLGLGAAKPVGVDDSRTANSILSGLAGGSLPAAIGAYRTGKAALDPLLGQAGMDRSAGRVLSRFATNPDDALANLALAKSNIPGVRPTVGEATLDPGLNTLERSMNNFPGQMQGAIDRRLAENNAARQQFLTTLAGTADDVTQAKKVASRAYESGIDAIGQVQADVNTPKVVQLIDRLLASPKAESKLMRDELTAVRAQFLEPYPAGERLSEAASIIRDAVNRAHKRGINAEDVSALESARKVIIGKARAAAGADPRAHDQLAKDALEALYGIETKTKGAQEAVQQVVDLIGAQNVAFKRDPARLAEIYKTINARTKALNPSQGADVEALKALNSVKRSLANWIDAADGYKGGYAKVNRDYAGAKREITQMEALQGIKGRSSGAPAEVYFDSAGNPILGENVLHPTAFLKATGQGAKVNVDGRQRALESLLDAGRKQGLDTLRADAGRAMQATKAGKANGSPTAQFLYAQQLLGEALGPIGLPTSMADRLIGSVTSAPFVGAGLAGMNNLAGRRMAMHMGDVLQDPARAAALMQAARAQDLRMLNPGVSRLLPPALAGLVGGGMFGQ